jgi:adenylate cyclase
VHNKLSVGFDCLGQQPMKNVAPVISYRVTTGGPTIGRAAFPAEENPAPRAGAAAAAPAGARPMRDRREPTRPKPFILGWLANQPRSVAAALIVAGFLIIINVFTGLNRLWFHWPVTALLFIVLLRTVLRRRPASNENEEHRASRE